MYYFLFPFVIISGLDFLLLPIGISYLFIKDMRFFKLTVPLYLLVFFSIISIIFNFNSLGFDRLGSALFNVSCVLTLATAINIKYNFDSLIIKKISISIFVTFTVLFFLYASLKFQGVQYFSFPTLLSFFINSEQVPKLLTFYLDRANLVPDYLNGSTVRFVGFGPYANACALFSILSFWLVWGYCNKALTKIVVLLLAFLMILETHSRASIIVFVASIFLFLFLSIKRPRIFIYVVVAFLFTFSIVFYNQILVFWDAVMNMRQTSSDTRLGSYLFAIESVFKENILLGVGARTKSDLFDVSIGSHSTLIGFFYKGGILSLTLFIYFNLHLLYKVFSMISLKVKDPILRSHLCLTISCILWMLYEDLDVLPLACVILGFSISLILNFNEIKK